MKHVKVLSKPVTANEVSWLSLKGWLAQLANPTVKGRWIKNQWNDLLQQ